MRISNFFKNLFFGVPVGITFVDSIGYVARVDGISMQPALNPDKNTADYVFLNRLAVKSYEVRRGDIVSLISPKDPTQKIIKRVVAIQGDIIRTLSYKDNIVQIPEGHFWIEGDHTGHSMDSNNFGPVSLGLLTAKASFIVWPPSRWQAIENYLPLTRLPLNRSSKQFYLGDCNLHIKTEKMRAISLVNKIEFEFKGNVVRSALTLGDVDNDGCNELVIGNDQGEVAIFKGSRRLQTIPDLGFVACVAVGDIRNVGKNSLVIIASNGWCYIYEIPPESPDSPDISSVEEVTVNEIDLRVEADETDGQGQSSSNAATSTNTETHSSEESTTVTERRSSQSPLICVHKQRIPANVKTLILGDIDGDGLLEIVVGLTDRVVRSYRFIAKAPDAPVCEKKLLGKLVALTKWECANQIGSISMHHSSDGSPSILVAQPGGTFMRIKCQIGDTTGPEVLSKSSSSTDEPFPGSVDYQSLGISRMRNQNISTEIVGDLKQPKKSGKAEAGSSKSVQKSRPYAVATLDGTIMLVQDEVILWAIAVDHQIFALTKLDVTGDGSDDIVVCTWDGLTYILDQQKNSVRFHLEEPVKAFESGWYSLDDNPTPVTALVYVTFKNTIVLYYDISIKDLLCKRFEPDLDKLSELFINKDTTRERALEYVKSMDKKTRKDLIEYLLYDATS